MIRPEHYLGAANEQLAAAYFLRQGFQVFWPAIPQSPVDFAVSKHGRFWTIQVKTASWNRSSPPHAYLQARTRIEKESELADVFVIVGDGDIWIIPSQKLDSSNLSLRTSRCPSCANRWDKYRATAVT